MDLAYHARILGTICYDATMTSQRRKPLPTYLLLLFSFVIPTIVLFYFSDESKLGPVWGMAVALAFPLALEVYSLATRRKVSYVSIAAIVGILLIGAISLLGLSEEWLAVRRSAIYILGALGIAVLLKFRYDLIEKGLASILDMVAIRKGLKIDAEAKFRRLVSFTVSGYALLLLILGIWSYILTVVFISAPTNSSEFNAQYAELRLLSLPLVSLPLLVFSTGLLMNLLIKLERMTGLSLEEIIKKK